MPANTPIPSPVALFPTVDAWLADMNTRFAANRYGQIDDADFRAVFTGMAEVFADWRHLSVKRVKGATYPVPYTDTLGLVAPEHRIVGMQAVALNGTDSATGGAGVVAPAIYYTLLRFSGGDVDALLDVEPNTVLTVKARWVQTSGGEEEKKASFPPLFLEDHTYDAGDVVQYTFPSGETRLFEFRTDSVGFQLPEPTGLDSDPLYKPFAPLSATAGYDDTQVKDRLTILETRPTGPASTDALAEGVNPDRRYFSAARAALLAPLDSPAFTGGPTVGTVPQFVAPGLRIANTQYVSEAIAAQFTPIVIWRPDATVRFLSVWPSIFDAPNGSTIHIRGNFGDANTLYLPPSYCNIVIHENAVFTCQRLCPQTTAARPAGDLPNQTISGKGTLRGILIFYDTFAFKLNVSDIRHEGETRSGGEAVTRLIPNVTFNNVTCVPPAGRPALFTGPRIGNSATMYFKIRYFQCRFHISGQITAGVPAPALLLTTTNHTPSAKDDIDRANCFLTVIGCHFVGDGANKILDTATGFSTNHFAHNTCEGMVEPFPVSDPGLKTFGLGGGSGAAAPAAAVFQSGPGEHYLNLNNGGIWLNYAGIKTVVFWMRNNATQNSNAFPAEGRIDGGTGYWYNAGCGQGMHAWIDGVPVPEDNTNGHVNKFSDVAWKKVIIENLCGASGIKIFGFDLGNFFYSSDLASLNVYSRLLTEAEKADLSPAPPTGSLLARYDFAAGVTTTEAADFNGNAGRPCKFTGATPAAI